MSKTVSLKVISANLNGGEITLEVLRWPPGDAYFNCVPTGEVRGTWKGRPPPEIPSDKFRKCPIEVKQLHMQGIGSQFVKKYGADNLLMSAAVAGNAGRYGGLTVKYMYGGRYELDWRTESGGVHEAYNTQEEDWFFSLDKGDTKLITDDNKLPINWGLKAEAMDVTDDSLPIYSETHQGVDYRKPPDGAQYDPSKYGRANSMKTFVGATERRPLKGDLKNYEILSVFVAGPNAGSSGATDGGRWRTYDLHDQNQDNFENGIVWALRGFFRESHERFQEIDPGYEKNRVVILPGISLGIYLGKHKGQIQLEGNYKILVRDALSLEGLMNDQNKSVFNKVIISKFQDNVDNLGYIIDGSYEYIMDDLETNNRKNEHWAWFVFPTPGKGNVSSQIDAIEESFKFSGKDPGRTKPRDIRIDADVDERAMLISHLQKKGILHKWTDIFNRLAACFNARHVRKWDDVMDIADQNSVKFFFINWDGMGNWHTTQQNPPIDGARGCDWRYIDKGFTKAYDKLRRSVTRKKLIDHLHLHHPRHLPYIPTQ